MIRLQHASLMSCTSLLITPSLRTLASFLNVLFPGGMQIVLECAAIQEKRAAFFFRFGRTLRDVHCLEAFHGDRARPRRILKRARKESAKYLESILHLPHLFYPMMG